MQNPGHTKNSSRFIKMHCHTKVLRSHSRPCLGGDIPKNRLPKINKICQLLKKLLSVALNHDNNLKMLNFYILNAEVPAMMQICFKIFNSNSRSRRRSRSSVSDPDGTGVFFSPIRIRVLKVWIRIHPLINSWDLNDGFDKFLEEPDQKGQC